MKPPHARKPEPVLDRDRITDPRRLHELVSGRETDWERLNPELATSYPEPTDQQYERARRREVRLQEKGITFKVPYDFHQEAAWNAEIDAHRRRQHARIRFLLWNDMLAGEALNAAVRLKGQHEKRERRHSD